MDLFNNLDDDNFILYAARNYYNPSCIDSKEFYEDLKRFKYIKRLLNKYDKTQQLSERRILNHIIVIFNVFGIEPAKRMLLYKLDEQHISVIKTFLIYLNYIRNDEFVDVPLDKHAVEKLRNI